MKLKDKGQSQNKDGTFTSKLDDAIIKEIIQMLNDAWLFGDILNDLMTRWHITDRTAASWIIKAQRIEMYMRKGLDFKNAKLAVDTVSK